SIAGALVAQLLHYCAFESTDEAIAAPMERLDEAGMFGVIAECRAQPLDGGIQAVVEVDKCPVGPELLAELFAGQHFSRSLEQHHQHVERLSLQPEPDAVLAQLAGADVDLESAESERSVRFVG